MSIEHHGILIIGAGLSGIGAACRFAQDLPDTSFALLESRECMGGTWDLFRYPGIRSDSDMYTLGYSFRPWTDPKIIADGHSIRDYIVSTAQRYGIADKIRYGIKVIGAEWSSEQARWIVDAERSATGERLQFSCDFLLSCTGYYNYAKGFTPDFPGRERYRGQFIHPQHWPENLDYTGKRVVIIGSGATAVTLLPSMADKAAHITMLQRSPTYIFSLPQMDKAAVWLRRFLPEMWVYRLARTRNVGLQMLTFNLCRRFPNTMKKLMLKMVEAQLAGKADMKHFTPRYNPWDERVCAVPNGDLFKVIRQGKASVVTDHIDTFTETGIRTKSGEELQADIVVSATGLDLLFMGGMQLKVDGKPYNPAQNMVYRGLMLSGLPNLALIVGYTNASWTLKADLANEYVVRLIRHMRSGGYRYCVPQLPPGGVPEAPFLNLQSGYVKRAEAQMPKQGAKAPWKLRQNYLLDLIALRFSRLNDGAMQFIGGKPQLQALKTQTASR